MGQDDSSSEEAATPVNNPSGKPAIPPRPRSISVDHKRFNNNNNIPIGVNKSRVGLEMSPMDLPCKDTDIANADRKCFEINVVVLQFLNFVTSKVEKFQYFTATFMQLTCNVVKVFLTSFSFYIF